MSFDKSKPSLAVASCVPRALAALLLLGAGTVATAASSYDNFQSGHLDPAKWTSRPFDQCNQATTLECIREVTPRKHLELGIRTLGANASDSGITYDNSFVDFAKPAAITSISADVLIPSTSSISCENNPQRSFSQFLMTGSFFSTGTSPDYLGDLDAYIFIDTNSPNGALEAGAFLGTNNTYFGNVQFGQVSPGEPLRLTLRWDKAGSLFVFSMTHLLTGQQTLVSIPYAQTVAGPPSYDFKEMGTRNFVANCTTTQTSTQMDALVDNVHVNSPVP